MAEPCSPRQLPQEQVPLGLSLPLKEDPRYAREKDQKGFIWHPAIFAHKRHNWIFGPCYRLWETRNHVDFGYYDRNGVFDTKRMHKDNISDPLDNMVPVGLETQLAERLQARSEKWIQIEIKSRRDDAVYRAKATREAAMVETGALLKTCCKPEDPSVCTHENRSCLPRELQQGKQGIVIGVKNFRLYAFFGEKHNRLRAVHTQDVQTYNQCTWNNLDLPTLKQITQTLEAWKPGLGGCEEADSLIEKVTKNLSPRKQKLQLAHEYLNSLKTTPPNLPQRAVELVEQLRGEEIKTTKQFKKRMRQAYDETTTMPKRQRTC